MGRSQIEHLGVRRRSEGVSLRDVVFWTAAARQHAIDVTRAWGIESPGVFFYDRDTKLPPQVAALIDIVDDDGDDEAAGYHTQVGVQVFAYVDLHQSANAVEVLTHEAAEIIGNPGLDRWMPSLKDPTILLAAELCDPVQQRTYPVRIEIHGEEPRTLYVADFVYPAWFTGASGPTSHCEALGLAPRLEPQQVGEFGYQIAVDHTGAQVPFPGAERIAAKLLARPKGRTAKLVAKTG